MESLVPFLLRKPALRLSLGWMTRNVIIDHVLEQTVPSDVHRAVVNKIFQNILLCFALQIKVKVDQRKIMTEEKLERLRLARETRERNRIAKEEERMELAKQMILASAGVPNTKPKNPEEKKLTWQV